MLGDVGDPGQCLPKAAVSRDIRRIQGRCCKARVCAMARSAKEATLQQLVL